MPLHEAAATINRAAGQWIQSISFWGLQAFRPNDEIYRIVRASVIDDHVCVLLDACGTPVSLRIWSPEKIEADGDEIRIREARRVQFLGIWDVTRNHQGDSIRVCNNQGTTSQLDVR